MVALVVLLLVGGLASAASHSTNLDDNQATGTLHFDLTAHVYRCKVSSGCIPFRSCSKTSEKISLRLTKGDCVLTYNGSGFECQRCSASVGQKKGLIQVSQLYNPLVGKLVLHKSLAGDAEAPKLNVDDDVLPSLVIRPGSGVQFRRKWTGLSTRDVVISFGKDGRKWSEVRLPIGKMKGMVNRANIMSNSIRSKIGFTFTVMDDNRVEVDRGEGQLEVSLPTIPQPQMPQYLALSAERLPRGVTVETSRMMLDVQGDDVAEYDETDGGVQSYQGPLSLEAIQSRRMVSVDFDGGKVRGRPVGLAVVLHAEPPAVEWKVRIVSTSSIQWPPPPNVVSIITFSPTERSYAPKVTAKSTSRNVKFTFEHRAHPAYSLTLNFPTRVEVPCLQVVGI